MFVYDQGSGPALVLIHGVWGDCLDWEPVIAPLAQGHRVLAVDLPGFGRSPRNGTRAHPADLAREFWRTMDGLAIREVSIVGNSFGGQVAICCALQAAHRVRKLVLVSTGGLHRFSAQEIEAALLLRTTDFLLARTPAINAALYSALFAVQGGEVQQRYIAKQNASLERPDIRRYITFMQQCMRYALEVYLLDELSGLRIPILLIQGDSDPIIQLKWAEAAAARLPQATLSVFPNCGHIPQLEAAERFIQQVACFLNGGAA